MNILIIDYLSYDGHKFFNRIHINALCNMGHNLCLVGKDGQFSEFKNSPNIEIKTIKYHSKTAGSVFDDIMCLYWIKKNIHLSQYEIIIIPTYDILSYITFNVKNKVYIINHNNIDFFEKSKYGKLRLLLTKILPSNNIHICLNEDMTNYMKSLFPSKQVLHVPHGVCKPSMDLKRPSIICDNEKFIFCPINRNFDGNEVKSILSSSILQEYLEHNNINLYIKNIIPFEGICKNIKRIDNNLEKPEYDYMLQNSMAILLPYPKQYKHRCSGIMFECISRNKPIICSDIEGLKIYSKDACVLTYSNINQLLDRIEESKTIVVNNNLDIFNPKNYWNDIFNGM